MTEEEPEPQGSGCAGAAVITMAVSVPLAILWAASREAFILALGAVGWGSVIWVTYHTPKSVQDAPDHSPEEESGRGGGDEPQVNATRTTKVGEACTIVSHPDERRRQRVEKRRAPDS